jgi:hypothetical protein
MFSCYLCPSDEWTSTGLCSTCHKIKNIVDCYTADEVLESLETLYLREKLKVNNKVAVELKTMTTRSKVKSTIE